MPTVIMVTSQLVGKIVTWEKSHLWKGTEAQAARSQDPDHNRYFLSRKKDTLCPEKKSVFLLS